MKKGNEDNFFSVAGSNTHKGIFKYSRDQLMKCLNEMSKEFKLNGADELIIAAFDQAHEISRLVKFTEHLSDKIPLSDQDRYLVYLNLCNVVKCNPESAEHVINGQNSWLSDQSLVVDPVIVFSIKAVLWAMHETASEGSINNKCPVCGADPDFYYIDGDGKLHLVCSRCDYDWGFKRTVCPFCGESDPRRAKYILSDDDFARLRKCSTCGRSILGVDERHSRRPFCYFLEKIITGYIISKINNL